MAQREQILIVDDDVELVDSVRTHLSDEGFLVSTSFTFASGMRAASEDEIDLAVLDVTLPDGSGLDLLHAIRAESSIPILLVDTYSDVADRVRGLYDGADDYLSKPCDPQELVARVLAIRRRAHRNPDPTDMEDWIRIGKLSLSPIRRSVSYAGNVLRVTSLEFDLLEFLMRRSGNIISREELAHVILGRSLGLLDRSVDVHISRLRKKLIRSGATEEHITAVRGVGYLLQGS